MILLFFLRSLSRGAQVSDHPHKVAIRVGQWFEASASGWGLVLLFLTLCLWGTVFLVGRFHGGDGLRRGEERMGHDDFAISGSLAPYAMVGVLSIVLFCLQRPAYEVHTGRLIPRNTAELWFFIVSSQAARFLWWRSSGSRFSYSLGLDGNRVWPSSQQASS
jgi:hypothetical protein